MDITRIDPASYATRVAQVAAAELYVLLSTDDDFPAPVANWFDPGRDVPGKSADTVEHQKHVDALIAINQQVEELGGYVCRNSVDQGERLFRWARGNQIIPPADWGDADFALRQAFETFVMVCQSTFLALATVQTALEDARAAAGVATPPLKREDSIFEEEESLGTLRPEAIAAAGQIALYDRARAEEERRLAEEKRQAAEAEAKAAKAKPKAKPAAQSVGEAPARPPVNKGGRGNKKAKPAPAKSGTEQSDAKKAPPEQSDGK